MKKQLTLWCLLLTICSAQAQETSSTPASAPGNNTSKFTGMVEIGFLYQDLKTNAYNDISTSPTFSIFGGYQLHRLLSVGTTVGADFYSNMLITPISLGLRGTLLNTRVSPFYSLDAGYGSATFSSEVERTENKGGWMVNPALGLSVKTGNNTAYVFSLGYKMQKASSKITWWNSGFRQDEYTFKRLSVRMGFVF
ncbi:hypothetical protein [Rufibacter roseus]|uniref:Outer membrane protein beta-barrel domain-containing protein n=1 Tax=Rufibacter roseus TaxID=1567108 RepID=A0ABW2DP88_9BACT|nr:hypothetical protein [Rufibacter roseus]